MRELGRRISGSLRAAGFVADSHGATAAGPLFDRSFGAWRRIIRTSIEGADRDQALIFISLLSDARPACVGGIPPTTLSKTWDRYGIACRSCA
jgi:hypothetical protein